MKPNCNVSYKDEETKTERTCQGGAVPNPAVWERAGLYVCAKCYPDVVAYLVKPYGKAGRFAMQAVRQAFRRVA